MREMLNLLFATNESSNYVPFTFFFLYFLSSFLYLLLCFTASNYIIICISNK